MIMQATIILTKMKVFRTDLQAAPHHPVRKQPTANMTDIARNGAALYGPFRAA